MENSSNFDEFERDEVIGRLEDAVSEILSIPGVISLVPDIGTNIVYASPHATSIKEVAGLQERISNISEGKKNTVEIEYGTSLHMATVVIEVMKHDPSLRAAINLRGGMDIVKGLEKTGIEYILLPRGRTSDVCPVETYLKKRRNIHRVYYHPGGPGMEATTTIVGKTPRELVDTVSELIRAV